MSRTSLGYFEAPLTQEERDMITVPFLGNKNKHAQISMFNALAKEVDNLLRFTRGNYLDLPTIAQMENDLSIILNCWSTESNLKCHTKEFSNKEVFNISVIDNTVTPSAGLALLAKGLYPNTFVTITQEDINYSFIDFANSNIELFSQPSSKEVVAGYDVINKMLTQYIDREIESSHIGRERVLDHSKFIGELIKTIKGSATNVTIENERTPFSIQPYVQETKDE